MLLLKVEPVVARPAFGKDLRRQQTKKNGGERSGLNARREVFVNLRDRLCKRAALRPSFRPDFLDIRIEQIAR